MKKIVLCVFIIIVALPACSAGDKQKNTEQSSESQNIYYQVSSDTISIKADVSYNVTLTAEKTWQFESKAGDDVTSWLVDRDADPALHDKSGIATIQSINSDNTEIVIAIDASKITGFTSNGRTDLYVSPDVNAISGVGDNHASYTPVAAKIGEYVIPTVSVEGEIGGEYTSEEGLSFTDDTITFKLSLNDKNVDTDLLDSRKAAITLLEGDGYYASDYTFTDKGLSSDWSESSATYTIAAEDLEINNGSYEIGENGGGRGWSELGGDGNGNYNLNFALQGLEYNGLPITNQDFRIHIYAYGRTFTVDNGSIYADSFIKWSTDAENDLPILADQYSDKLILSWASGIDASQLREKDFILTMKSAYGDSLTLKPGTDFNVDTDREETIITVSYTYWANAPVYTVLDVEVTSDHLNWDKDKYKIDKITYSYDIASVYVYNVMAGGQTGTQTWTVYGLDGLQNWQQLFNRPTYTLSYTDDEGKVQYYSTDNNGSFVNEEKATKFDASEDVNIALQGNTGYFTRQFDQTEDKLVGAITYTFDKVYSSAETAIKNPNQIEGVTVKSGYIIGEGWEDHLRWPWQNFIDEGYRGGRS